MLKLISELFKLLSPSQRKHFYRLQLLVIFMAIVQVIGVASIGPFMAVVGDMSILTGDGTIGQIYKNSGINNVEDFVFFLGVGVLATLTVGAFFAMYTIWKLSTFSSLVGTELADKLYQYYLQQPWLYHSSKSSAIFTKQVSTEAMRVADGVIAPLMQMNARAVLAIVMSLAIFVFKPQVAITGLLIFISAYAFLFKIVRKKLQKNGQVISGMITKRFQIMAESFGGIKDVLLLGRSSYFINRFQETGRFLANGRGNNIALGQVPRYFMELIAFGSIIFLILFLLKSKSGNLSEILPILAIYALAGFKLLPAFQQIYTSLAQVKGNIPAFEAIKDDLFASRDFENKPFIEEQLISFESSITFKNVCFTYPSKSIPTIKNLNLKIVKNTTVALVGSSGCGKSTIIDLLLGLTRPNSGDIQIDNQPLNDETMRSWQGHIGFVSQSIFLSENSIAENIAFGIPKEEIDFSRIEKVIELAHLKELINQLPEGVHSKVGERGIQLSGGQRQRIGIARALYNDADVLVFDEATSALDGITENLIMRAINDFSKTKTIILVAHRLKTVKNCDMIFFLDQGRIFDKGSYDQLVERNEVFREMAMKA